jgi:hypothetical protein
MPCPAPTRTNHELWGLDRILFGLPGPTFKTRIYRDSLPEKERDHAHASQYDRLSMDREKIVARNFSPHHLTGRVTSEDG